MGHSPRLVFEGGFDERKAFEAEARGYRAAVHVAFPDGRQYPVVFYDPTRLQQTLEDDAKAGSPFLAEPGLIAVSEVTRECMTTAVEQLAQQGFFDALIPVNGLTDDEDEVYGEATAVEPARPASRARSGQS